MNIIRLTKGLVALVSAVDYPGLNCYSWYAQCSRPGVYYAARTVRVGPRIENRKECILMHQQILGTKWVDHKNHATLDNRRCNLRPTTPTQNLGNSRRRSDNLSGYKGVSWDNQRGQWRADVQINRRRFYLGHFLNPAVAARAYDRAAVEKFGEFAYLNFPKSKQTH